MGIIELIFILAASFIVFLIVLLIIRLSSPRQSRGYTNQYSNANAFVKNDNVISPVNVSTDENLVNNNVKGKFKYKKQNDDSAIKRSQEAHKKAHENAMKAHQQAHQNALKIHKDTLKRLEDQRRIQDSINRQRRMR